MNRRHSLASQPLAEHSTEFATLATQMIKRADKKRENRAQERNRITKNEHPARVFKKYKFNPSPKGSGGGFRQRVEKPISEIIKAAHG
jgi:hypothetical protein